MVLIQKIKTTIISCDGKNDDDGSDGNWESDGWEYWLAIVVYKRITIYSLQMYMSAFNINGVQCKITLKHIWVFF